MFNSNIFVYNSKQQPLWWGHLFKCNLLILTMFKIELQRIRFTQVDQ